MLKNGSYGRFINDMVEWRSDGCDVSHTNTVSCLHPGDQNGGGGGGNAVLLKGDSPSDPGVWWEKVKDGTAGGQVGGRSERVPAHPFPLRLPPFSFRAFQKFQRQEHFVPKAFIELRFYWPNGTPPDMKTDKSL